MISGRSAILDTVSDEFTDQFQSSTSVYCLQVGIVETVINIEDKVKSEVPKKVTESMEKDSMTATRPSRTLCNRTSSTLVLLVPNWRYLAIFRIII